MIITFGWRQSRICIGVASKSANLFVECMNLFPLLVILSFVQILSLVIQILYYCILSFVYFIFKTASYFPNGDAH
jgi:hypothetical protein